MSGETYIQKLYQGGMEVPEIAEMLFDNNPVFSKMEDAVRTVNKIVSSVQCPNVSNDIIKQVQLAAHSQHTDEFLKNVPVKDRQSAALYAYAERARVAKSNIREVQELLKIKDKASLEKVYPQWGAWTNASKRIEMRGTGSIPASGLQYHTANQLRLNRLHNPKPTFASGGSINPFRSNGVNLLRNPRAIVKRYLDARKIRNLPYEVLYMYTPDRPYNPYKAYGDEKSVRITPEIRHEMQKHHGKYIMMHNHSSIDSRFNTIPFFSRNDIRAMFSTDNGMTPQRATLVSKNMFSSITSAGNLKDFSSFINERSGIVPKQIKPPSRTELRFSLGNKKFSVYFDKSNIPIMGNKIRESFSSAGYGSSYALGKFNPLNILKFAKGGSTNLASIVQLSKLTSPNQFKHQKLVANISGNMFDFVNQNTSILSGNNKSDILAAGYLHDLGKTRKNTPYHNKVASSQILSNQAIFDPSINPLTVSNLAKYHNRSLPKDLRGTNVESLLPLLKIADTVSRSKKPPAQPLSISSSGKFKLDKIKGLSKSKQNKLHRELKNLNRFAYGGSSIGGSTTIPMLDYLTEFNQLKNLQQYKDTPQALQDDIMSRYVMEALSSNKIDKLSQLYNFTRNPLDTFTTLGRSLAQQHTQIPPLDFIPQRNAFNQSGNISDILDPNLYARGRLNLRGAAESKYVPNTATSHTLKNLVNKFSQPTKVIGADFGRYSAGYYKAPTGRWQDSFLRIKYPKKLGKFTGIPNLKLSSQTGLLDGLLGRGLRKLSGYARGGSTWFNPLLQQKASRSAQKLKLMKLEQQSILRVQNLRKNLNLGQASKLTGLSPENYIFNSFLDPSKFPSVLGGNKLPIYRGVSGSLGYNIGKRTYSDNDTAGRWYTPNIEEAMGYALEKSFNNEYMEEGAILKTFLTRNEFKNSNLTGNAYTDNYLVVPSNVASRSKLYGPHLSGDWNSLYDYDNEYIFNPALGELSNLSEGRPYFANDEERIYKEVQKIGERALHTDRYVRMYKQKLRNSPFKTRRNWRPKIQYALERIRDRKLRGFPIRGSRLIFARGGTIPPYSITHVAPFRKSQKSLSTLSSLFDSTYYNLDMDNIPDGFIDAALEGAFRRGTGGIFAHQGDTLMGGSRYDVNKQGIWAHSIGVRDQFQRMGVGSSMVNVLKKYASRSNLPINFLAASGSSGFHEKLGARKIDAGLWGYKKYATGGLIKGPGTGTSDSISTTLPPGYVIPTSTVSALGSSYFNSATGNSTFKPDGTGIQARVSNGEYFLPRSTVNASGGTHFFDKMLSYTRDSVLSPHEATKLFNRRFASGGATFADGGDAKDNLYTTGKVASVKFQFPYGQRTYVKEGDMPLPGGGESLEVQKAVDKFTDNFTKTFSKIFADKMGMAPEEIAKSIRTSIKRPTHRFTDEFELSAGKAGTEEIVERYTRDFGIKLTLDDETIERAGVNFTKVFEDSVDETAHQFSAEFTKGLPEIDTTQVPKKQPERMSPEWAKDLLSKLDMGDKATLKELQAEGKYRADTRDETAAMFGRGNLGQMDFSKVLPLDLTSILDEDVLAEQLTQDLQYDPKQQANLYGGLRALSQGIRRSRPSDEAYIDPKTFSGNITSAIKDLPHKLSRWLTIGYTPWDLKERRAVMKGQPVGGGGAPPPSGGGMDDEFARLVPRHKGDKSKSIWGSVGWTAASISMSSMGVYFSMLGIITSVQSAVMMLISAVSDLNKAFQSVGYLKAFGSTIGLMPDQITAVVGSSKQLVDTWKKVTAIQSYIQVMFANLAVKLFDNDKLIKTITGAFTKLFDELSKKETMDSFTKLVSGLVDLIPSLIPALNTFVTVLSTLAENKVLMQFASMAFVLAMLLQPVMSLVSAFGAIVSVLISMGTWLATVSVESSLTGRSFLAIAVGANSATAGLTGMNRVLYTTGVLLRTAVPLLLAIDVAMTALNRFGAPVPQGLLSGPLLDVAGIKSPEPQGYAIGGEVNGPGDENDDRVPALLSDGEYIINAKSARKLGRKTLDKLNKYAVGGANNPASIPSLGIGVAPSLAAENIQADMNETARQNLGVQTGIKDSTTSTDTMIKAAFAGRAHHVIVDNLEDLGGDSTGINLELGTPAPGDYFRLPKWEWPKFEWKWPEWKPDPLKVETPKIDPLKVEEPKPVKVEEPKPVKVEEPKPVKVEEPKPVKVEVKVEEPKPVKVEEPKFEWPKFEWPKFEWPKIPTPEWLKIVERPKTEQKIETPKTEQKIETKLDGKSLESKIADWFKNYLKTSPIFSKEGKTDVVKTPEYKQTTLSGDILGELEKLSIPDRLFRTITGGEGSYLPQGADWGSKWVGLNFDPFDITTVIGNIARTAYEGGDVGEAAKYSIASEAAINIGIESLMAKLQNYATGKGYGIEGAEVPLKGRLAGGGVKRYGQFGKGLMYAAPLLGYAETGLVASQLEQIVAHGGLKPGRIDYQHDLALTGTGIATGGIPAILTELGLEKWSKEDFNDESGAALLAHKNAIEAKLSFLPEILSSALTNLDIGGTAFVKGVQAAPEALTSGQLNDVLLVTMKDSIKNMFTPMDVANVVDIPGITSATDLVKTAFSELVPTTADLEEASSKLANGEGSFSVMSDLIGTRVTTAATTFSDGVMENWNNISSAGNSLIDGFMGLVLPSANAATSMGQLNETFVTSSAQVHKSLSGLSLNIDGSSNIIGSSLSSTGELIDSKGQSLGLKISETGDLVKTNGEKTGVAINELGQLVTDKGQNLGVAIDDTNKVVMTGSDDLNVAFDDTTKVITESGKATSDSLNTTAVDVEQKGGVLTTNINEVATQAKDGGDSIKRELDITANKVNTGGNDLIKSIGLLAAQIMTFDIFGLFNKQIPQQQQQSGAGGWGDKSTQPLSQNTTFYTANGQKLNQSQLADYISNIQNSTWSLNNPSIYTADGQKLSPSQLSDYINSIQNSTWTPITTPKLDSWTQSYGRTLVDSEGAYTVDADGNRIDINNDISGEFERIEAMKKAKEDETNKQFAGTEITESSISYWKGALNPILQYLRSYSADGSRTFQEALEAAFSTVDRLSSEDTLADFAAYLQHTGGQSYEKWLQSADLGGNQSILSSLIRQYPNITPAPNLEDQELPEYMKTFMERGGGLLMEPYVLKQRNDYTEIVNSFMKSNDYIAPGETGSDEWIARQRERYENRDPLMDSATAWGAPGSDQWIAHILEELINKTYPNITQASLNTFSEEEDKIPGVMYFTDEQLQEYKRLMDAMPSVGGITNAPNMTLWGAVGSEEWLQQLKDTNTLLDNVVNTTTTGNDTINNSINNISSSILSDTNSLLENLQSSSLTGDSQIISSLDSISGGVSTIQDTVSSNSYIEPVQNNYINITVEGNMTDDVSDRMVAKIARELGITATRW